MKKSTIYRAIFYIAGLLILALGIVLNTKATPHNRLIKGSV